MKIRDLEMHTKQQHSGKNHPLEKKQVRRTEKSVGYTSNAIKRLLALGQKKEEYEQWLEYSQY